MKHGKESAHKKAHAGGKDHNKPSKQKHGKDKPSKEKRHKKDKPSSDKKHGKDKKVRGGGKGQGKPSDKKHGKVEARGRHHKEPHGKAETQGRRHHQEPAEPVAVPGLVTFFLLKKFVIKTSGTC